MFCFLYKLSPHPYSSAKCRVLIHFVTRIWNRKFVKSFYLHPAGQFIILNKKLNEHQRFTLKQIFWRAGWRDRGCRWLDICLSFLTFCFPSSHTLHHVLSDSTSHLILFFRYTTNRWAFPFYHTVNELHAAFSLSLFLLLSFSASRHTTLSLTSTCCRGKARSSWSFTLTDSTSVPDSSSRGTRRIRRSFSCGVWSCSDSFCRALAAWARVSERGDELQMFVVRAFVYAGRESERTWGPRN